MKLHAPSSLLTTGINSTLYQLLSGLPVGFRSFYLFLLLQVLLVTTGLEGFPPVSFSHKWLVPNGKPLQVPGSFGAKSCSITWHMEFVSECLCFSLSITTAGTHFKTCDSCSAINTNIPLYVSPWGHHRKPLLLLFLDAFSFSEGEVKAIKHNNKRLAPNY